MPNSRFLRSRILPPRFPLLMILQALRSRIKNRLMIRQLASKLCCKDFSGTFSQISMHMNDRCRIVDAIPQINRASPLRRSQGPRINKSQSISSPKSSQSVITSFFSLRALFLAIPPFPIRAPARTEAHHHPPRHPPHPIPCIYIPTTTNTTQSPLPRLCPLPHRVASRGKFRITYSQKISDKYRFPMISIFPGRCVIMDSERVIGWEQEIAGKRGY